VGFSDSEIGVIPLLTEISQQHERAVHFAYLVIVILLAKNELANPLHLMEQFISLVQFFIEGR
jgi:hypothetical protein